MSLLVQEALKDLETEELTLLMQVCYKSREKHHCPLIFTANCNN